MTLRACLTLLLGAGIVTTVHAEKPLTDLNSTDIAVIRTSAFAHGHPDLSYRLSAIEYIEQGRHDVALRDLHRAARYGDKPSQAMIAESYWMPLFGQQQDRIKAYIWMDLAAERAFPVLIAKREAYWSALTEDERAQAVEQGQAFFAEYGDDVALPRLQNRMTAGRRQQTGSRIGAHAGTETYLADAGPLHLDVLHRMRGLGLHPYVTGGRKVDLWSDKFWKLDEYLAWKAVELDGELTGRRHGIIQVKPLEPVDREG